MAWLVEPSLDRAAAWLADELPHLTLHGRTLVAIGRCRVEYRGRAESELGDGDRLVVLKGDGALLVHDPTGFKPVNWQPPGCRFRARAEKGALVVDAERPRPAERVRIRFERLALLGSSLLERGAPLELRGSEWDVREALRRRPELVEPGFVPWEPERLTERGPMDLYGEDGQGRRVVIEVKRVRAGLAEATQLWRYVEKERQRRGASVRGLLIAPACSDRARLLLEEHGLEFRAVDVDDLRQLDRSLGRRKEASLLKYAPEPRETGRH